MDVDLDRAERFVEWLQRQAVTEARGDEHVTLRGAPRGRFWLGRLASEAKVRRSPLGERAERLEPCEAGFRVRPADLDGRVLSCRLRANAWRVRLGVENPDADRWEKGARIDIPIPVPLPHSVGAIETAGRETVAAELSSLGFPGLAAEVRAEIEAGRDGPELVLTVVNVSPDELEGFDTSLYEVELEADVGPIQDFVLDGLPESFRYDRHVPAFGVNGSVERLSATRFVTSDAACHRRRRPGYWDDELLGTRPMLTFDELSKKPVEGLAPLVDALSRWTAIMWSDKALSDLAARRGWDGDMMQMARHEADRAAGEVARVGLGLKLLDDDETLRRAFSLANRSFARTPSIEHHDWRPFQLGFVLANLAAIVDPKSPERDVVDTLWFATGGGKTETYLLYVLVAAFHDRLTGKMAGITSWARFPLRMLSLQQTQRFADVFAAAELVRLEERIGGAPFSIGFLVGEGGSGSPNRVSRTPRAGDPDPNVPGDFAKFRVLIRCPFCLSRDLYTTFDTHRWALDHLCKAPNCPWGGGSPPPLQDRRRRDLPLASHRCAWDTRQGR